MPNSVLVYPRYAKRLVSLIAARYDLMDSNNKPPAEVYSADERAKVVAWVASGASNINRAAMDQFPNLKMIACYGTGYDGVDRQAAKAKGIVVCNSPGANAAAVADQSIALMLAAMRDIPRLDAFVREGRWGSPDRAAVPAKPGLPGCKVGIYGMGAIGEKIAARMAGFESDVQYFSRRKLDHLPYRYHPTLESLVEWCDVLHIAVRAAPDNKHIIDAGMLRRLGPGGYVINIARGSVIDEAALIEALQAKTIAGAGLDVFDNEPKVRPEFFTLPNVVLAPHQGGHTVQAHEGMQDLVMANLDAFFAGKPAPFAVSLD